MSELRKMRRAIARPIVDLVSPRHHRLPMQAKLAGYNIWICQVCSKEEPMDPIAVALMSPAPTARTASHRGSAPGAGGPPGPPAVTYVVAKDHQHFRAWCIDNRVSHHDPSVRYVRDAPMLHGRIIRKDIDVVAVYPHAGERRDFDDIMRTIAERTR